MAILIKELGEKTITISGTELTLPEVYGRIRFVGDYSGTKIQGEVIIDYSHYWHITIGENVTIAPRVHILAHDASTKLHLGYTKIGKVDIGNNNFYTLFFCILYYLLRKITS
jgi:acetyltransferase-like isoleucine patch superfamily enzyme